MQRLILQTGRRYPLLIFVISFGLGQVGGEYIPFLLCCLAVLLVGILVFFSRAWASMLPFAFFVGTVTSARVVAPHIPLEQSPLIVEVDARPRYRKTGEIEVSLRTAQGERYLCKGPDVPWRNSSRLREGSTLFLVGTFRPLIHHLHPFHYENGLIRRGYQAICKIRYVSLLNRNLPFLGSLRDRITNDVQAITGSSEDTGLFLSMFLGIRDQLSPLTEDAFKKTGLAHLLVLSGYQITLVYYLVIALSSKPLACLHLRWRWIPWRWWSYGMALSVAMGFAAVVGIESSSARAGISAVIVMISTLAERGGDLLHALSISLLILLWWTPGGLLDPSIQLTYAALLGVYFAQGSLKNSLMNYFKVCFCSMLCTGIVTLLWFSQFSIGGFMMNILFGNLMGIITCQGGIFATLLYEGGIDRYGWGLQLLVYATGIFKQFLFLTVPYLPLTDELSPTQVWIEVGGIIGMMGAWIGWRRRR